jgi:ADP-ribose pyrophosphatase
VSPEGGINPWELVTQRPGPGRWMNVVTNIYRMPNGAEVDWDLLVAPDAVAVFAVTDSQEVVLARQYRPGPNCFLNELPGGNLNKDETPLEAARRELQEETGYLGEVVIIGHTWQGATITRRKWAAVATGCRKVSEPTLDPSEEFCETVTVPVPEFRLQLQSGQLTDAWAGYAALDHLGLLGLPPPSSRVT